MQDPPVPCCKEAQNHRTAGCQSRRDPEQSSMPELILLQTGGWLELQEKPRLVPGPTARWKQSRDLTLALLAPETITH